MQNIIHLFQIYSLLAIIGIGPCLLLSPMRWRLSAFSPILFPLYGLAIILVCSCWGFGLNRNIIICRSILITTSLTSLVAFSVLFARYYFIRKNLPVTSITRIGNLNSNKPLIAVVLCLFLSSFLPMLDLHENSLLDERFGIDAPQYIDAAQSFQEKNTLHTLGTVLSRSAFIGNDRWGAPFYLGNFSSILHLKNAFELSFSAMCLVHGFLAASMIILLNRCFRINIFYSVLGGSLLALNCNMLNLTMETQWAEMLALPFIILGFSAWLEGHSTTKSLPKWQGLLSAGIFFGAAISSFSEAAPLIIATLACMELSALYRNGVKSFITQTLPTLSMILIAILAVLPYSLMVADHLLHLTLVGVGYKLPLYATPAEVFGFQNIFHRWSEWMNPNEVANSIVRKKSELILNIFYTAVSVAIVIMGYTRMAVNSRWLWYGIIPILCLGVGKFIILDHTNYSYMKFYTLMLPLLLVPFIKGLESLKKIERLMIYEKIVLIPVVFLISLSGIGYLMDFKSSSKPVSGAAIKLHDTMSLICPDGNCFIVMRPRGFEDYKVRYVDRSVDFCMIPLLRHMPIIDEWSLAALDGEAIFRSNESKIFCVLDKHDVSYWPKLVNSKDVIFDDMDYMIIKVPHSYDWFMDQKGYGHSKFITEEINKSQ